MEERGVKEWSKVEVTERRRAGEACWVLGQQKPALINTAVRRFPSSNLISLRRQLTR